MSSSQNSKLPTRSPPKQRHLSISNYSTMVSEEKDQYIEKLRKRNHRAWEKIQELEDNNSEFWRTIKKQQNLLEVIRGTLHKEKSDFTKQIEDLRSQKNDEILLLKKLLLKERGAPETSGTVKSEHNSNAPQKCDNDSISTENLTSLQKLRTTSGDNNYFFHTNPKVKVIDLAANQTEAKQSDREEIFSKLLQKADNETSQDGQCSELKSSEQRTVNKNVAQSKTKLDSGVELENKRSKELLQSTELQEENASQERETQYKDPRPSTKYEFEVVNRDIKKEIVEVRKELLEKNIIVEENALRIEELTKSLAEAEAKILSQQNLIQKVNELDTLVHKVREDRAVEIMSLTQEYQLEKQKKITELEALRQQFEWMKVSKLLTINSVAAELERLRNAQSIFIR